MNLLSRRGQPDGQKERSEGSQSVSDSRWTRGVRDCRSGMGAVQSPTDSKVWYGVRYLPEVSHPPGHCVFPPCAQSAGALWALWSFPREAHGWLGKTGGTRHSLTGTGQEGAWAPPDCRALIGRQGITAKQWRGEVCMSWTVHAAHKKNVGARRRKSAIEGGRKGCKTPRHPVTIQYHVAKSTVRVPPEHHSDKQRTR